MSKEQTAHLRRIDQLGRISVPKDIRDFLDLKPDDALRITRSGHRILMEKNKDSCVFCSGDKDLLPFGDKFICTACRQKIAAL